MKRPTLLLVLALLVTGCASTDLSQSDARQPRKVGDSLIRLADQDFLELTASRTSYSFGTGARWVVALAAQQRPDTMNARWRTDVGQIEESRPLPQYEADVKVHRDRIAIYTPWNDQTSVVDRLDGWLVQRDTGKRLFDHSQGRPEKLIVRFREPQTGGTGSASQP